MLFNRKTVAAVILSGLFVIITGCARATQPDDFDAKDGNAGFMATELNDMSNTSLGALETGSLGKAAVNSAETLNVEYVLSRWQPLDADSSCWVRHAQITYPAGTRDRYDTAWFYGAGGIVKSPRLATVDSVVHKRYVTNVRGGMEIAHTAEMHIVLVKTAGDTHAVKNGTIVGTFNGVQYRTCTVTNVKRYRTAGAWDRFPSEGVIFIDKDAILARRSRTITITFTGNNTAQVEVKRKTDGKTYIVNVNLLDGSEI